LHLGSGVDVVATLYRIDKQVSTEHPILLFEHELECHAAGVTRDRQPEAPRVILVLTGYILIPAIHIVAEGDLQVGPVGHRPEANRKHPALLSNRCLILTMLTNT